mmetsp:Transcript_4184/g.14583  ORF Transcript_4184/g.14583 Transcript_4184/m.14583 type:complete len:94 (-) Transcript_4184:24-305(-)
MESYEENAEREIEEEMGITGVQLCRKFDFFFEDEVTRVHGRMFECVYDGEMTLQESEVESGRFMPVEAVAALLEAEPTCPDSKAAFRKWLEGC